MSEMPLAPARGAFDVFSQRSDAEGAARGRIRQGAAILAFGVVASILSHLLLQNGTIFVFYGALLVGALRLGAGVRDLAAIRRTPDSPDAHYAVRMVTFDEPTGWQAKAQTALFALLGVGIAYGLLMNILGR